MKKLFIAGALTLLTTTTFAQHKCILAVDETDEFTGTKRKATRYREAGKGNTGKLLLKVAHLQDEDGGFYAVYAGSSADLGCSTSSSYMYFLFEDGSKLKIQHGGDIECGDDAVVYNIINYSEVNKPISKIRLGMSEYYEDYEVYDSQHLINELKCIKF
jgi:hypothetical protein